MVEAVLRDVGGDKVGDQVEAGIAVLQAVAEFSGRNVFVDAQNVMNPALLLWVEVRESCAIKDVAGTRDDDPLGELKKPCWFTPSRYCEERIHPYDGKQSGT